METAAPCEFTTTCKPYNLQGLLVYLRGTVSVRTFLA